MLDTHQVSAGQIPYPRSHVSRSVVAVIQSVSKCGGDVVMRRSEQVHVGLCYGDAITTKSNASAAKKCLLRCSVLHPLPAPASIPRSHQQHHSLDLSIKCPRTEASHDNLRAAHRLSDARVAPALVLPRASCRRAREDEDDALANRPHHRVPRLSYTTHVAQSDVRGQLSWAGAHDCIHQERSREYRHIRRQESRQKVICCACDQWE